MNVAFLTFALGISKTFDKDIYFNHVSFSSLFKVSINCDTIEKFTFDSSPKVTSS